MSFFKKFVNTVGQVAINVASEGVQQARKKASQQAMSSGEKMGGKTVREWDSQWRSAGNLATMSLTEYNRSVGLYRARLGGEIVYIGRAIEWNNGGFRKRLSDYRRESNSGRTHGSGQKMNAHKDSIHIDLLIVGSDAQAAQIATKLEGIMVGKYSPEWNKIRNFN